MAFQRTGLLCVVSGPSGCGKTTLCRAQAQHPGFLYSISCTTRAPRQGEVNGKDYHFLYEEEFLDRVRRKQFLEYAKVHEHYYGTLKSTVLGHLQDGVDVLMDLDVQGAEKIRRCRDRLIQNALVDLFIMPPSLKELHRRLSGRATEDEGALNLRLDNAREEIKHWREYQYVMISGTPSEDRASFQSILDAERLRSSRLTLPSESKSKGKR